MIEKRKVFRQFQKTISVEAEVTSGGRLFQRWLPATGNARSLAARMTMTGDVGGWKRRRNGCSHKDTVAPGHSGISR